MCLGADGLSITMILLRELISGAPFGSISDRDIDIVLCALEAPHIYEEFIEREELIMETAKLLIASIQHLTKPIPDTVRVLIIWVGLILRAASAVRQNLNHVAMADEFRGNLGSEMVVAEVNQAILCDLHPQPAMSDLFGRYSPTLLQWLESARTTRNPRTWMETSIEIKMLEIIVSALDPDALEDSGVPEQLAWMLGSAGSSSGTGKADELGCVYVRIRSMEMLSFLFRIDQDYAHFRPYTAQLFTILFNPGLKSIEYGAFSSITSDLPALVEPYLQIADDATNISALTLMAILIRKLQVEGAGYKWDETAIPPILSFLKCINDDSLLARKVLLEGLLAAPSTSMVFHESQIRNCLKECLDKQLSNGSVDDPDQVSNVCVLG
ncbi:hypothetical protein BJV82DRAFT_142071 [Fennellomyces sp. T-0311]|nr:hypothetical protein BJV82DRAFT_142071 [Fennellomyces sp. T-0311]